MEKKGKANWQRLTIDHPIVSRLDQGERRWMSWLQLCHILGVKKLLLDFTSDVAMVLNECLDLAMRIVEQVEMVGEVDVLPYLQDVGSAALSSLGLFLYDVST